ncbi:MAG TPA: alpha/beta hydrolase [Nocardioides sp.]|nr:alpha/beta hydrolase [Nocardioides sp.]
MTVRTVGDPNHPAVLALHGWPGLSSDWSRVVPLVEEVFWIVPDLRGFGGSDAPVATQPAQSTPGAHARDLHAVLDHFAVPAATVAGHDIGATIARVLAQQEPDRVTALALFNPPYPGIAERRFTPSAQRQFWYQHLHQLPLAEALLDGRPSALEAYLGHFYKDWSGAGSPLTTDELNSLVDAYSRPGRFTASIAYYRARAQAKLSDAVTARPPTPPAFVAWGEQDPVMPVEWADRLDTHFDLCHFERVPGVGHFLPLEAPEVAARTIRTALVAAVDRTSK